MTAGGAESTERSTPPLPAPSGSEIMRLLQDPAAVWVNMLRGTIARPACLLDLSAVEAAVESEPELPGDMPDEMWNAIRNDRVATSAALRIVVRQTKAGILKRIGALYSPNETGQARRKKPKA